MSIILKKQPQKSLPALEAYIATEPTFRAEVAAILSGVPDQGVPFFDNSGPVPTFRRLV